MSAHTLHTYTPLFSLSLCVCFGVVVTLGFLCNGVEQAAEGMLLLDELADAGQIQTPVLAERVQLGRHLHSLFLFLSSLDLYRYRSIDMYIDVCVCLSVCLSSAPVRGTPTQCGPT